jgi:RNA polymerase sigma-70 factor (ECF subfamily)
MSQRGHRRESNASAAAGTSTRPGVLAAAQAGDERSFESLIEPHRRELHLHCYRMLGEVHDADDAFQESLLRAWRGLGRFEPRAPLRAWLYRIATNVCLTTLESRRANQGRSMPSRRSPSDEAPGHLGPYPDRLLDQVPAAEHEPGVAVEHAERVGLAFVAAVQLLTARQRAVLLLRDVLGFTAREVSSLLDTSVAAVNSARQRAHATLEQARSTGNIARPHSPTSDDTERELVRSFAHAWREADVDRLVQLLVHDALLAMPPQPLRVVGRDNVAAFLVSAPAGGQLDRLRLVEARANDQPVLAAYLLDLASGRAHAYAILVLALDGGAITSITRFGDPRLFDRLGLPRTVADTPAATWVDRATR